MRFIRSRFVQELAEDGETVWRPRSRPTKSGWACHDMGDGTALVAYDDDDEVSRAGADVEYDADDGELTATEVASLLPEGASIGRAFVSGGRVRDRKAGNAVVADRAKKPRVVKGG